jgi:putative transposase
VLRWAAEPVSWHYIQPASRWRTPSENFNSKLRDECLNEHFFFGLAEAQHVIEDWRQDYNQLRPHSSLGALASAEYANRQGGGPPEQAQGSAGRPLAPPPHLGQTINLTLLINAPKLGCMPIRLRAAPGQYDKLTSCANDARTILR